MVDATTSTIPANTSCQMTPKNRTVWITPTTSSPWISEAPPVPPSWTLRQWSLMLARELESGPWRAQHCGARWTWL